MKVISRNQSHGDSQLTYALFKNINTIIHTIAIVLFSFLRALAKREENILGVNFQECNLLIRNPWKFSSLKCGCILEN